MSPKPAWKYGLHFFEFVSLGSSPNKKAHDALVTENASEYSRGTLCGFLSRYRDGGCDRLLGRWYLELGHGGQGQRSHCPANLRECFRPLNAVANLVARPRRVAPFFRANFVSMVKQSSINEAYALLGLEQVGKPRDHRRLKVAS